MATEKVGVYRKYHGKVPTDKSGRPLPTDEWPRKRPFRWAARWYGLDGNRYSRSFRSRKEAERFANNKQQQIQRGKRDQPNKIALADFAAEHEKVMLHQVARGTLRDQMRALRMFMDHVGKNMVLRCIRPRHAESFIATRLASGVKVGTANKDIRTLRRIFNLAIEPRGYLSEDGNPFRSIKQRRMSPRPIRYVSPSEFRALQNAASDGWWQVFLFVAYTSAARRGELLNLMWTDVDRCGL